MNDSLQIVLAEMRANLSPTACKWSDRIEALASGEVEALKDSARPIETTPKGHGGWVAYELEMRCGCGYSARIPSRFSFNREAGKEQAKQQHYREVHAAIDRALLARRETK